MDIISLLSYFYIMDGVLVTTRGVCVLTYLGIVFLSMHMGYMQVWSWHSGSGAFCLDEEFQVYIKIDY